MALVNQQRHGNGLLSVGFANPLLYAIGDTKGLPGDQDIYKTSFHDVIDGNMAVFNCQPNTCDCTASNQVAFSAGDGYDLVTGWGSPTFALINQLSRQPKITVGVAGTSNGGPSICIGGTGFTPGGTVTVQYAGVPEVPNDVKVVSSNTAVGGDGTFNVNDNEQAFVNQAYGAGPIAGCTADEIASGVVTVNAIDNTYGVSATATIPASYWCQINQTTSYGAACMARAIIYYDQYAACTSVPTQAGGSLFVGPNAAYVVFEVDAINNQSPQAFNFDPNKLYVQQATQHFADSTLDIYHFIFDIFGAVPNTYGPGESDTYQQPGFLAAIVHTDLTDGAIEANQTHYTLYYATQPTDPPVTLVNKSSPSNWSVTHNCCDIGIATCN